MESDQSATGGCMRLGLIGAGGFGAHTADLVREIDGIELVGVADVNVESAERVAASHGIPHWADHVALLRECHCDAVAVVTPHNAHRDIVIDAARAGHHVFCEKAMAITVADCHDMIEACAAAGVKLMVGHKRRLRPAYREIKRVLDSGRFGRMLAVNVAGFFGRRITGFWSRRTECGGLLYWAGVHDIDTLRHLFGEVSRVFAVTGPKVHPEVSDQEDSIAVTLEFASGMIGTLQVSTYFPMADYHTSFAFQIVGEHGGIAYDRQRRTITAQIGDEAPTEIALQPYNDQYTPNEDAKVAYLLEWSSFADWVLHDAPPVLTGEDGLRCVEILQAAYISADTGSPVDLPLDRHERRPFE
jgi:predicted dehydrogenase